MSNPRRYMYLLLIVVAGFIQSETVSAKQTATNQYCAALFQFYNETGTPNMDILQFSLREKLFDQLTRKGELHLIDQATLNDRVIRKDLDILDNLTRPHIMQYIGGLVNADLIIFGSYTVDNGAIVVLTHLVDATQGKQIKSFKISGQMYQIDLIMERIAEQIFEYITIWQQIGGFVKSQNIAHHLGQLVAEAEIADPNIESDRKADTPKILELLTQHNLTNAYLMLYNLRMTTVHAIITECTSWFNQAKGDSSLKKLFGINYFMHAVADLQAGNIDQAKKHFNTTLMFLSDNDSVLCSIAGAYRDMEAYNEATELYTKCIQKNPDNVDAYIGISEVYMAKKEYVLATFFLTQALTNHPEERELYILMAKSYAGNDRLEKAINSLKDGLQRFPDDSEMGRLMIHYYRLLGPSYQPDKQTELPSVSE